MTADHHHVPRPQAPITAPIPAATLVEEHLS